MKIDDKASESLGVTRQFLKSSVAFCFVCRNRNPGAAGKSWTCPELLCSSQGTLWEQEAIPFLRLPPRSLQPGKRHLTHGFELQSLKCSQKKADKCMCPTEERSLSEQWEMHSPNGFYVRNINGSKQLWNATEIWGSGTWNITEMRIKALNSHMAPKGRFSVITLS